MSTQIEYDTIIYDPSYHRVTEVLYCAVLCAIIAGKVLEIKSEGNPKNVEAQDMICS